MRVTELVLTRKGILNKPPFYLINFSNEINEFSSINSLKTNTSLSPSLIPSFFSYFPYRGIINSPCDFL